MGTLVRDEDLGWYYSAPVAASALGGALGQVVVTEEYVAEHDKTSIHAAVAAFLTEDDTAMRAASPAVYAYYLDTVRIHRMQGWDAKLPDIADADDVWRYVRRGREFHVERDAADGQVYVSIECECAWEPEHGLQLVFRNGRTISKVGPFDGHLTNASAHAREDLAPTVYLSPFDL